ncbi:MAG: BRCT domain-containing protein [Linnemannia gamsii]|nr:MAG: BRCT domain-containing protein [Linnemannia gamsii]
MSHSEEDTGVISNNSSINEDEHQQQQQLQDISQTTTTAEAPMSVIQHNPGSPAPMTPTSNLGGDEEVHNAGEEVYSAGEEEDFVVKQGDDEEGRIYDEVNNNNTSPDLLFQDVVFFLSPFLRPHLADELEAKLCGHGAMKARTSASISEIAWSATTSPTTHIISENLDIPDYKHAVARGIHIVTPEWVRRSIGTNIVQDPYGFSADPKMIFSGLCMATTGLPDYDRQVICAALDSFGGTYSATINMTVTHLIALAPSGAKYDYVSAHPELNIKIVLPHWFQRCCNAKRLLSVAMYMFPDPPIQENDDELHPTPLPGYAPQLFANHSKPVVAFLNSPSINNQQRVLENKYIYMADDLSIIPELRIKFEEKISQAGGILVDEYASDMVDIFICRFRAGNLYYEASNDGKIVGSADWLYHILSTGEFTSPKAALLHYPIPHEHVPGMSSLVITVSNYTGQLREYLKRMILAMGGNYKATLSSKNAEEPTTHIVCGDPTGEKYEKGQEWNVKIVNHFWVEDCFLSWCLQSETQPRYVLLLANSQLAYVFGAGFPPEALEEWIIPDASDDEGQAEMTEAGDEKTLAHVEPEATSSPVPEGMADMAIGEEVHEHEHLEPEQEQRLVEASSSRRSSSGPAFMEGVETHQSTPSPRKSTPRPGSKSAMAGILKSAIISPLEAPSSSSSLGDNDSAMSGSHSPGGVRVVSRKRGAALEATKALQQIVPDMNDFQEELRDEKRRKKRGKTALIDEPEDDDVKNVNAEETTETSPTRRKTPASPAKRKRVSMGTVVEDPGTPAKSQEDTGNESEDTKTPSKKTKRATKADKEKEREAAAAAESTNGADASATAGPASKLKQARYITTGLTKEPSAKQIKALKALGILSTNAVDQCTHLVAKSVGRTEKFLSALALGKIIVQEDWLQACIDANAILDESEYQIQDPDNEAKFGMNLYESLERAREKKVFENCVFYISPSTVPKLAALKVLIEAGGGKATALLHTGIGFLKDRIVKRNQRRIAAEAKAGKAGKGRKKKDENVDEDEEEEDEEDEDDQILAIVSCESDSDMWQAILDVGERIYSHELIIFGVLRQHLDLDDTHALA